MSLEEIKTQIEQATSFGEIEGAFLGAFGDKPVSEKEPWELTKEDGLKTPWKLSEEQYARLVHEASKPTAGLDPSVSLHQLSTMSGAAIHRRAKDRIAEKKDEREKYKNAAEEWKDKVWEGYLSEKFNAEDVFDTDAFYVLSEHIGASGIEMLSPFKLAKMEPDEREPYLSQIDKEVRSSSKSKEKPFDMSGPYSRQMHQDMIEGIADGKVDLATFKALFEKIVADKREVMGELVKLTKKDLLRIIGGYASMSDKKDRLVAQAYSSLTDSFIIGNSISWGGNKSKEDALREMVESYTEEDIKAYRDKINESRARFQEMIEQRKKAIENPETYEEYATLARVKGEEGMTPEQRMQWDKLQVEKSLAAKEAEAERKTEVKAISNESVSLEFKGQTVHAKKGTDLFIVGIVDRVERDAFNDLKAKAKQFDGWYSTYRGRGAIPGFQFTSMEAAEKFMALQEGDVSNADIAEEKEGKFKEKAAEKLTAMADDLEERANDSLNQDRKTHTPRMARMASSAEDGARKNIRMAKTMRNLARAIESGESKLLGGIKAKTQIEMLDSMVNRAKYEYDRDNGIDYEKSKDSPVTVEHMLAAGLPKLKLWDSVIIDIANDMENIKGGSRLATQLRKREKEATKKGNDGVRSYDFSNEEDLMRSVLAKYDSVGQKDKGWQVREEIQDRDRLARMGLTTDAEVREALREYLTYREDLQKADPIKEAERALAGTKIPGYFPTPTPTVKEMIEKADIRPGMKVLEPSAGKGNIADQIKKEHPDVELDVVEPQSSLRDILEAKGYNLVAHDFMQVNDKYDRIIMNPPFENRQDVDHVMRAYSLLKPGGVLVAIMSEGPFFGTDKKAVDFREWLDDIGYSEKLPEGTFKSSERPTGVATRMVVIEK